MVVVVVRVTVVMVVVVAMMVVIVAMVVHDRVVVRVIVQWCAGVTAAPTAAGRWSVAQRRDEARAPSPRAAAAR